MWRLAVAMILFPALGTASTCPDKGDLRSGIKLETSTGAYSIYILGEEGIVKVEEYAIDGQHYRTLHFSQYVLEARSVHYEDGSVRDDQAFDFSYEFDEPLRIEVGASFHAVQRARNSNGDEFETEYTISFSPQKRIQIGGCRYTYLEVKKEYVWPGDQDEETVVFLQELGLLFAVDPIPYNLRLLEDGKITRL